MSVYYHLDVVGKPFFQEVQDELNSRKTLGQDYDHEPSYFRPYFKLRRIAFEDSKNWELRDGSVNYPEGKPLSVLGTYSGDEYNVTEGLNALEERDSEYKLTAGITNVNIEVTDFVLYTVTVDFSIPDISQFEDFKAMWLDFGLPVEMEWGRSKNYETRNANVDPQREVVSGNIAYFDYSYAGNRSIKGQFKIYTRAQYFQIGSESNKIDREEIKITEDLFRHIIKTTALVDSSDDSINKPDDWFYSIIDKNKFEKLPKKLVSSDIADLRSQNQTYDPINAYIFSKIEESVPMVIRGTEIIPEEISLEGSNLRNARMAKRESGRKIRELEEIIDGLRKQRNVILKTTEKENVGNDRATEWRYVIPEKYAYLRSGSDWRIKKNGDSTPSRDLEFTDFQYNKYLKKIEDQIIDAKFELISEKNRYENLNNSVGEISNLYKFLISKLSLDESEYYTDQYYYISFDMIEYLIMLVLYRHSMGNENVNKQDIKSSKKDIEEARKKLSILHDLNISKVPIFDLSSSGFGSIYPDKLIINPWQRRYNRTDNNEIFEEADNGKYTLLKDVYISVYTFFEILENVDTVYGLLDSLIQLVNSSTKKFINLKKSIQYDTNMTEDYVATYKLTVIDQSLSTARVDDNFYEFDLFDPREKIKNLEVVTDIPDEMSSVAFFKNTGIVTNNTKAVLNLDEAMSEDLNLSMKDDTIKRESSNRRILTSVLRNGIQDANERLTDVYEWSDFDKPTMFDISGQFGFIYLYYNLLFKVYEAKGLINDRTDSTIEIPLKISFALDGIAKIITGQVFRVSNRSFPIGYNFDDKDIWSLFSVMNTAQTISNGSWMTTIEAQLYINQSRRRNMLSKVNSFGEVSEDFVSLLNSVKQQYEDLLHESTKDSTN